MKALTISNSDNSVITSIQDEIRRNHASRYDHRLHGILLVAKGLTCREVGLLMGDSPRTVVNWVQRFKSRGLAGLSEEERPGRPTRLDTPQLAVVEAALRQSPSRFGLSTERWDGPSLSEFLRKEMGVDLKVRQCQRLFRQLGFRFVKGVHPLSQTQGRSDKPDSYSKIRNSSCAPGATDKRASGFQPTGSK